MSTARLSNKIQTERKRQELRMKIKHAVRIYQNMPRAVITFISYALTDYANDAINSFFFENLNVGQKILWDKCDNNICPLVYGSSLTVGNIEIDPRVASSLVGFTGALAATKSMEFFIRFLFDKFGCTDLIKGDFDHSYFSRLDIESLHTANIDEHLEKIEKNLSELNKSYRVITVCAYLCYIALLASLLTPPQIEDIYNARLPMIFIYISTLTIINCLEFLAPSVQKKKLAKDVLDHRHFITSLFPPEFEIETADNMGEHSSVSFIEVTIKNEIAKLKAKELSGIVKNVLVRNGIKVCNIYDRQNILYISIDSRSDAKTKTAVFNTLSSIPSTCKILSYIEDLQKELDSTSWYPRLYCDNQQYYYEYQLHVPREWSDYINFCSLKMIFASVEKAEIPNVFIIQAKTCDETKLNELLQNIKKSKMSEVSDRSNTAAKGGLIEQFSPKVARVHTKTSNLPANSLPNAEIDTKAHYTVNFPGGMFDSRFPERSKFKLVESQKLPNDTYFVTIDFDTSQLDPKLVTALNKAITHCDKNNGFIFMNKQVVRTAQGRFEADAKVRMRHSGFKKYRFFMTETIVDGKHLLSVRGYDDSHSNKVYKR